MKKRSCEHMALLICPSIVNGKDPHTLADSDLTIIYMDLLGATLKP